jgi:putative hydrolase of the HAD superfamily
LQQKTLEELEQDHLRLLNELHPKVLQGILSLEEARLERLRQLFSQCGEDVSATAAEAASACYWQAYQMARRPLPGAIPLLKHLRSRVRIAVVTNNVVAEQRDKLVCCGLDSLVDALVVSEEVGVAKPEAAIFKAALNRVKCCAEEAVMVGDSWEVDILGAH